ncbi:MaoC family dehydratase [Paraconexibacter algicola]|uniref:Dehydratase n=1 Tax=Paraconexibacter algicola TaxID=2133960 RepID=A0A2T4ULL0_9ACTN|nr:MaoC family dehydratase [Paraconexibacter algicola]PTL60127.1 dehydratase [Paraconexibacter algicola]
MSVEELQARVGETFGPTAWRTVDQDMVDTFATLSGDRQWIHTDVERAARESPFGTTIAHGNLTLSMIDGFRDELVGLDGFELGVNLGYDRVRFPSPVPVGARVRAVLELAAVSDRGDGWWQVVQRFTVEVEGGTRPACVADSVIRVRPRTDA